MDLGFLFFLQNLQKNTRLEDHGLLSAGVPCSLFVAISQSVHGRYAARLRMIRMLRLVFVVYELCCSQFLAVDAVVLDRSFGHFDVCDLEEWRLFGNQRWHSVRMSNTIAWNTATLVKLLLTYRPLTYIILENPSGSWLFKMPFFADIIKEFSLFAVLTYMGMWGLDLLKGTRLVTNLSTPALVFHLATLCFRKFVASYRNCFSDISCLIFCDFCVIQDGDEVGTQSNQKGPGKSSIQGRAEEQQVEGPRRETQDVLLCFRRNEGEKNLLRWPSLVRHG